jgi:hypothetical protein
MIEAIRYCSNHTLLGVIAEGIPALLKLTALINQVALGIILQVVISIPLFYLYNNLFALGFAIGFVFDKQVSAVVEKVNVVYNAHRTLLERTLVFGGGGFLALLTMQTSMVIATLYYSAQWGALFYQNSLSRYPQPGPPVAPMGPVAHIEPVAPIAPVTPLAPITPSSPDLIEGTYIPAKIQENDQDQEDASFDLLIN